MSRIFLLIVCMLVVTACGTEGVSHVVEMEEPEEEVELAEEEPIIEGELVEDVAEEEPFPPNPGNATMFGTQILVNDEVFLFTDLNNFLIRAPLNEEGEEVQLTNYPVSDVHVVGETIYYIQQDQSYQATSVNRMDLEGSRKEVVYKGESKYIWVSGDQLILGLPDQQGVQLANLNVATKELTKTPHYATEINVADGWIYFYQDQGYMRLSLNGEYEQLLQVGKGKFAVHSSGEYLFYTVEEEIGIHRLDVETGNSRLVVEENVYEFNTSLSYLYYTYGEHSFEVAVHRSDLNGEHSIEIPMNLYSLHTFSDDVIGEFSRQEESYIYVISEGEVIEVRSGY